MKISELLAANPQLDRDLPDDEIEGLAFLDGVYLFRTLAHADDISDTALWTKRSDHTDWLMQRGMLAEALNELRKQ